MYFASVLLLLLILPLASIFVDSLHSNAAMLPSVGRWFVFWAVGVRLFIAGLRQVVQPRFTAEEIFEIRDRASFPIVRELGFANLSMGLLGTCTIVRLGWVVPAAIAGGLYYGLAGAGHIFHKQKNAKEWTARISDGFVFVVLAVFVTNSVLSG